MSDTIVRCTALSKRFRSAAEELSILDGLDLEVERGDSLAIVGSSGSGKSTLLSIIGGLDAPTGGSLTVDGAEIPSLATDRLAEFRMRTIGFIFQFHFLLKDFTALENVMLPALMAGARKRDAATRALSLLVEVGVEQRSGHYPSRLSGGERQRVAIARALVNDPALILADEPTGNLDAHNAAAIGDMLFGLAEARGKTLLIVTHDQGVAARAARRVELAEGRLRPA